MSETIKLKIIDRLLKEPIVTIILIGYSVFMGIMLKLTWNKINAIQDKLDNCQSQQVELLKTVVQDNTKSFNDFREEIKDLKN